MGEIAKTHYADENTLRQLAIELARDIHNPEDILKSLNLTEDDYQAIKDTRAFRAMYNSALSEWNSAGNTQKRVKLKAAVMTEEVLPFFYKDLEERRESLTSRVALLGQLAKIGGLGQEAAQGVSGGQMFRLEIHLQGRPEPVIIDAGTTLDEEALPASSESEEPMLSESALVTAEDYDEL